LRFANFAQGKAII